jgi:hypothetical protein
MTVRPEAILNDVKQRGIIPPECDLASHMAGTTAGKIYTVNLRDEPQYVLKIDKPEYLKGVDRFLQTYSGLIFPKVRYTDPAFKYILYDYIKGSVYYSNGQKRQWLSGLAELAVNEYRQVSEDQGWGWLDEPPFDSWLLFLKQRTAEARGEIGDILPEKDHHLVMQLPDEVCRSYRPKAYFLHGDCGVHNFIFDSSGFQGIIDPAPMIGPPHYDFIFAFCSSPDDLSMDTLLDAARALRPRVLQDIDRRVLVEEVLIQLYCRIATCLKYHSHHLSEYLQAWAYWSRLTGRS